ncbi:DUF167 domain-containing protein [Desulforhopalus singaporensis]|uniref:UPF0235 protein SAMN05660330_00324 n=1 Tax=Desulforhopalus singaporensis TaxID=91360 RepID=A0A1H0JTX8_9BACT|nr:DUF167 domain-containing protein [Desulforhopalus singaporensis]SDO47208.1 hypothetical protein SAMN05660330_00324 [Desulforhopalus singaporensis]
MPYLQSCKNGGVILELHVQPKASRTQISGLYGERLKVAVGSPPVDGKANKEIVSFFAKLLGVSKKNVEVVSGHKSRQKVVAVAGVAETAVRAQVKESMSCAG